MSDRTALIATLAWETRTRTLGEVPSDEECIREAIAFVEQVEKLTRPEPRQCQALQPFNGEEFRGVCDLPDGHSGKHMDGGFIW